VAVLSDAGGRDFFSLIHDLHETLLVDAKPVVEIAAWTMVGLILIGPALAWPRLRNTLPGWHLGIGWILFPLVLLPAGTEALRTLGVARAQWVEPGPSTPPIAWGEALRAAGMIDLSRLASMRRMPQGGVALITGQDPDTRTWIVTNRGVTAAPAGRNWPKDLHDGIWAAPWSGWVSLASAGALLGLLGTGSVAWARRRMVARRRAASGNADSRARRRLTQLTSRPLRRARSCCDRPWPCISSRSNKASSMLANRRSCVRASTPSSASVRSQVHCSTLAVSRPSRRSAATRR